MNYGIVLPFGDPHQAAEIAVEAEQAGWDGFFVWEPIWGFDAWILLTAAAMRTTRLRLGTFLSPISRMRPWKLASETMTLDHLSAGRVTLAVGLGALDTGFAEFGEETDRRRRAELLDEALDILQLLWAGGPPRYDGRHYRLREHDFPAPPPTVQQPGIPVWCVAIWPSEKSMARVLRAEGLIPERVREADGSFRATTPDDVTTMVAWLRERRTRPTPLDVIRDGETPGDRPAAAADLVLPWAAAGVNWWLETRWMLPRDADGMRAFRERVRQGPPPQP